MFCESHSITRSRLRARKLIHRRITDLNDLREIYTIGDIVGKGNFGTVVKAKQKETKTWWAIKIINKRQAGASRVLAVEREIYILKLVDHPNIIFLDCVFESPRAIYLVFELCIESLAKIFNVKKRFDESETINIIQSLSSALAYLHKNDIVHRDLKLENILTAYNPDDSTNDLLIKVTDFGLSTVRNGPGYENMLHDFCGTLAYMAPEMIATKSYSQQCDVWSMGIIMYVLLFGKFPFFSSDNQQLCKLISKENIDFSEFFRELFSRLIDYLDRNVGEELPCSQEARHLLSKLLEKNPAFRLTAAEVEHHPWIIGDGRQLQTESSNVLDMMRLWRDEMLVGSEIHDTKNKCQQGRRLESLLESKNRVSYGTINDKSSMKPSNDNVGQENSNETKTSLTPQSNNKQYDRGSCRLPDFSHIPAKVDSNLTKIRKGAMRKRESTRKSAA